MKLKSFADNELFPGSRNLASHNTTPWLRGVRSVF